METLLFIKVGTIHHSLAPASLTEGTATLCGDVALPVRCTDCHESLQDGPCRLGRVECYGCGKQYPIETIMRAVQAVA